MIISTKPFRILPSLSSKADQSIPSTDNRLTRLHAEYSTRVLFFPFVDTRTEESADGYRRCPTPCFPLAKYTLVFHRKRLLRPHVPSMAGFLRPITRPPPTLLEPSVRPSFGPRSSSRRNPLRVRLCPVLECRVLPARPSGT